MTAAATNVSRGGADPALAAQQLQVRRLAPRAVWGAHAQAERRACARRLAGVRTWHGMCAQELVMVQMLLRADPGNSGKPSALWTRQKKFVKMALDVQLEDSPAFREMLLNTYR